MLMSSPNPLDFEALRAIVARVDFADPSAAFFALSRFLRSNSRRWTSSHRCSAAAALHLSASSASSLSFFCVAGIKPAGSAHSSHDASTKLSRRSLACLRMFANDSVTSNRGSAVNRI